MIAEETPRITTLLDGVNSTRVRVDQVLNNSQVITAHGAEILTQNRANLERTMANVKDASDYGVRLVQKLYGNPFYLSPFYKPTAEDVAAQEMYDVGSSFMLSAKELNDTVNRLQAMRSGKELGEMTKLEQDAYNKLFQRSWGLLEQIEKTNGRIANGIGTATPTRRR